MHKSRNRSTSWFLAFGGPSGYTGRDLRVPHEPLVKRGLTDKHFDIVAEHLRTTLVELGVDDTTVTEVLGIVGSTRNDVLNR